MTRDQKFLLGEFAFIIGVILFPFVEIDLWILFLMAGLSVALIFSVASEKIRILLFMTLFLAIGIGRFATYERGKPSEEELQALGGKKTNIECRIASMPEFKNGRQQIILEVKDKKILNGKILAYASVYEDHSYGDTVNFSGTLKRPESFEGFDYPKYLRGKNIYLVSYYPTLKKVDSAGGFYSVIFAFRRRADENINKILPSPEGNIVSAMTLGMTSPETKEVMAKFNQTGTSHVIVVSGSHLVIIVAILMFFLLRLGVNRGKAFYMTIFGIFSFVILSGSSASAIRSGIMAFVFLLAVKVGRGGDAMRALIFSAAVMIFFNLSGSIPRPLGA